MSDPCRKCGAARSCEHRTVEGPRVLDEHERPKSRGPGRRRKYTDADFEPLIDRATAYCADRNALRQEASVGP